MPDRSLKKWSQRWMPSYRSWCHTRWYTWKCDGWCRALRICPRKNPLSTRNVVAIKIWFILSLQGRPRLSTSSKICKVHDSTVRENRCLTAHDQRAGLEPEPEQSNKQALGAENHEGLRNLPCMPAVDKGIEDWHFQNLWVRFEFYHQNILSF